MNLSISYSNIILAAHVIYFFHQGYWHKNTTISTEVSDDNKFGILYQGREVLD